MTTTATQRGRDLVEEYTEAHGFPWENELENAVSLVRDVLLYVEDELGPEQIEYVLDSVQEGL